MQPDRPLLGILLVAVTVLFFSVSDVLTKHLTTLYPVPLVIAVRYLASLVLLIVFVLPTLGARLWRTERTGMVLIRAAVLTLASLSMGHALRLMPVGEAVAISYLAPILVMILAIPLLGEWVGWPAWVLAVVGFLGVLLIMRPGVGLDPAGVAFAFANAASVTVFHLMTRVLGRTETTIALLFHVTIVGTVFFGVAALPALSGPLPGLTDLGLMALLGVVATVGHFLFALAYRQAPASLIAPVNYMHLVWAALLGWLIFRHVPDGLSVLGIAMVAASGVALALRSHIMTRRTRRPLPEAP